MSLLTKGNGHQRNNQKLAKAWFLKHCPTAKEADDGRIIYDGESYHLSATVDQDNFMLATPKDIDDGIHPNWLDKQINARGIVVRQKHGALEAYIFPNMYLLWENKTGPVVISWEKIYELLAEAPRQLC